MSEMIERVARAVATELGDDFDLAFADKAAWRKSQGNKDGRYRDINEPTQADFIEVARAVLRVMREPTPAVSTAVMIAAGKVAEVFEGEVYIRGDAGPFIVAAMIDEALK